MAATHFQIQHPIHHGESGAIKPLKRGAVVKADTFSEKDQQALLKSGAIKPHTAPAAEEAAADVVDGEIVLSKLTVAQLIDYALKIYGITFPAATKKSDILAAIQAAADDSAATDPAAGDEE